MAESSLDSLRQTHDMQVEWRAFELRPEDAPPLPPELEADYRQRILETWPRVQQIARERFGLEMRRTEETVRRPTRLAHTGAKYASEQAHGDAYHLAVFRAHWQELRDISSPDLLVEIAGQVGLDQTAFRAALSDERYIAAVEADENWAYQHGLSAVPAFILGGRYLVTGAQPADVLRQVADRCREEGRVV